MTNKEVFMYSVHPVFAQTVIRVNAPQAHDHYQSRIFRIYGVEQPLHVVDPRLIIPRNDNNIAA